ncbi:MAG: 50S ribosomal protein L21 [Lachnospiraceae bacterium]|nr:50S ribosomal protein L21 [Lachnospiraceae bacterium]
MYAIIATGGKQYKVSEGDLVKVEKLDAKEEETVTFDDVIAISDNGSVKVAGSLDGASVSGTVLRQGKDRKVVVYKYKPKSGYHKKNGHRQPYTLVKIDKISL